MDHAGAKKGSARLINRRTGIEGKVWLDEYYERAIRSEAQLLSALRYIHGNPVTAGLVEQANEYAYSSANPRFETDLAVALGILVGVETTPTTGTRGHESVLGVVPDLESQSVGVETTPTTAGGSAPAAT